VNQVIEKRKKPKGMRNIWILSKKPKKDIQRRKKTTSEYCWARKEPGPYKDWKNQKNSLKMPEHRKG